MTVAETGIVGEDKRFQASFYRSYVSATIVSLSFSLSLSLPVCPYLYISLCRLSRFPSSPLSIPRGLISRVLAVTLAFSCSLCGEPRQGKRRRWVASFIFHTAILAVYQDSALVEGTRLRTGVVMSARQMR